MTAGEMTAALAQWKDHIEAAGKGFPTDGELTELMILGAALEAFRIREAVLESLRKGPLTPHQLDLILAGRGLR